MKAIIEITELTNVPEGDEFNVNHYNNTIGFYKVNNYLMVAYFLTGAFYTFQIEYNTFVGLFDFMESEDLKESIIESDSIDSKTFLKALAIVINKEKFKDTE